MSVKLLMTWDITPDHEQEYFEFVIGEFVPGIQRLGLEPAEAWATIYGDYPQIQVGVLATDSTAAKRIMASQDWSKLLEKLSAFVSNFKYKIVPARGGFQF